VSGWTADAGSDHVSLSTLLIRPRQSGTCITPDTFDLCVADDWYDVRLVHGTNATVELDSCMSFPRGSSNLLAWYSAGYTLPVDNANHVGLDTVGTLPEGLVDCVNKIVKASLDGLDDDIGGAQSASYGGDYSYNLAENGRSAVAAAVKAAMPLLIKYANVRP
jgi:hypothetical protein